MPIFVRNIKLELDEPEDLLLDKVASRLKVSRSAIRTYAPVRRSLDARKRGNIGFVYCLEVALDESLERERHRVARLHRADVALLTERPVAQPSPGHTPMRHRPVVVGFGPAGMFAGWQLAQYGYKPIILERGQPVRIRHQDVMQKFYRQGLLNPESNLLYGEGGAGAYSDGKLYTRVSDPLAKVVLQVFYEHGASPDILVDGNPHIGSDRLPSICKRIRYRIESMGGEIRFGARVDDLMINDGGQMTGVMANGARLTTDHLLLAPGHSARDTIRMLADRGVCLVAKPFQLGVRIEHPQSMVDRWQYGAQAGHDRLPPADYHLVAKGAGRSYGDLFSFCMCPGGTILPTIEAPSLIATNGASRSSRSGPFANSGLVITIPPEVFNNDPLQGLRDQRKWEALAYQATGGGYAMPAQRARDFLDDKASDGALNTSYPMGCQWVEVRRLVPPDVADSVARGLRMLDERLPGFAGPEAIIAAPETRASSPVRMMRDVQTRESVSTGGLYPIGEGAGYAGGIVSAAIDGIKSANQIIMDFAPPD